MMMQGEEGNHNLFLSIANLRNHKQYFTLHYIYIPLIHQFVLWLWMWNM